MILCSWELQMTRCKYHKAQMNVFFHLFRPKHLKKKVLLSSILDKFCALCKQHILNLSTNCFTGKQLVRKRRTSISIFSMGLWGYSWVIWRLLKIFHCHLVPVIGKMQMLSWLMFLGMISQEFSKLVFTKSATRKFCKHWFC